MSSTREHPRPYGDVWKFEDNKKLALDKRILKKRGVMFPSSREVTLPKPKGKVPVYREWDQMFRLSPFITAPIVLRWALMRFAGVTIPGLAMYGILVAWNLVTFESYLHILRGLAQKYGYLDGEAERDSIPAGLTWKLLQEILHGVVARPLVVVALTYDRSAPVHISWWLPLQLCAFSLIMDFMYYWVHRLTHESDTLWYLHRRHHTTKHPSAYLLGFADEPQEMFDLVASPIFAQMVFPLNFESFYIWMQLLITTEIMGHSGLRIHLPACMSGMFLRPFGCELVLEDHDLHHRFGWRDSANYGKSTRMWDVWFGTVLPRIECRPENIDWSQRVR